MDLTQGTEQEKIKRAKKMMLWFGIISLIMSFAGLTSAFIVSSSREDWLQDFQLPTAFTISTVIIVISSITMSITRQIIIFTSEMVRLLFNVLIFSIDFNGELQ